MWFLSSNFKDWICVFPQWAWKLLCVSQNCKLLFSMLDFASVIILITVYGLFICLFWRSPHSIHCLQMLLWVCQIVVQEIHPSFISATTSQWRTRTCILLCLWNRLGWICAGLRYLSLITQHTLLTAVVLSKCSSVCRAHTGCGKV